MKLKECLKAVLFILIFGLFLSIGERNVSAELSGSVGAKAVSGAAITNNIGGEGVSETKDGTSAEELSGGVGAKAVSGGAITYYIGGEGASDTNDGTSSTTSFATLYKAISNINSQGAGSYEILVQGDTTETQTSVIGDGITASYITIYCEPGVTSVINRGVGFLNDMIQINSYSTLILGNKDDTTSTLIINGNGDLIKTTGRLIYNDLYGTLNLYSGVELTNNSNYGKSNGGAVCNCGTANIYGGKITRNIGLNGGAISNFNELNLYDGTISENTAINYGGGIYNTGDIVMSNGLIDKNTAAYPGGGIYVSGTMLMTNGIISNNYSYSGGGLYVSTAGSFTMENGEISNNTSDDGGGLKADSDKPFILKGGVISGNTAKTGGGVSATNVVMSGGIIKGNSGAGIDLHTWGKLYMSGGDIKENIGGGIKTGKSVQLSGNSSIYSNDVNCGDIIFTEDNTSVYLNYSLTSNETMVIVPWECVLGRQVLTGYKEEFIKESHAKFKFLDTRIGLDDKGCFTYYGPLLTYYVGGEGASDLNDGSSKDTPFASLERAVTAVGICNARIVIQSDLSINQEVIVTGKITVVTDGKPHIISRGTNYKSSLIFIRGGCLLNLGDKDNISQTNQLIFDGKVTNGFNIIRNNGTLNLYSEITLKNDDVAVFNSGKFNMYGGIISKNCDTAISNSAGGTFAMYGGIVSNNVGEEGGGVINYGEFVMTGGSISNNSAKKGGGVYNDGKFTMSGGAIRENTAEQGGAIYNDRDFDLSGNASIPTGIKNSNDIYYIGFGFPIISGNLSDTNPITITSDVYKVNERVIYGDEKIVAENYLKFKLASSSGDFIINSEGRMEYIGIQPTYYVNALTGSDINNDGTSPFASLQKAVDKIEEGLGIGRIILQSDIKLEKTVFIKGTITIVSDGNKRTISRSDNFLPIAGDNGNKGCIIFVYGNLILGNSENNDKDTTLFIDGKNGKASAPGELIYIKNKGYLYLYSGVSIQNNLNIDGFTGGIDNNGTFYMHGGEIKNNKGKSFGGVYNTFEFIMTGGIISNNNGYYAGGVAARGRIFKMTGGIIDNNSGYRAGGVENCDEFYMSGGEIHNNTGEEHGGIYNSDWSSFNMMGGAIYDNVSLQNFADDVGQYDKITLSGNAVMHSFKIVLTRGKTIIIIEGKLTGTNKITVIPQDYDDLYCEPGRQLISPGENYTLTKDDIDRFQLSDRNCGITLEGKIFSYLQKEWISFSGTNDFIYNGNEIKPNIVIDNGHVVLIYNTDYTVKYENNINAGTANIIVTGIGNYSGQVSIPFTIQKSKVQSIISASPMELTISASNNYSADQLKSLIKLNTVEVQTNGAKEKLGIKWNCTAGEFNQKGGIYTYTGTLISNSNVMGESVTLTTNIIVTPVSVKIPEFNSISVPIGKDKAATASDLGDSILPTSGSYHQEGSYEADYPNKGTITYTIDWGKKTLNTTSNKSTTTFVGKVTYVNYPKWLTIPENVTVSRTVSVTGKMIVDINCDIKSKTYDGKPVSISKPYNEQGYTGGYEIHYVSTDKKGYSSKSAPKNAGDYKCIISIADDLADYTGSKELYFTILPKNITIIVDSKTIFLNEPLPNFTYHYKKGDELISGDTLIVEPTLSAPSANTGKVSDYPIEITGANAGENYTIYYVVIGGVLSVKAPASYSITTSVGANGTINPNGMQSILHNTDKTFVITPNKNYEVLSVLVDGVDIGSVTTYTFHDVTANHSISVTFKATPTATPTPTTSPSSDGGGAPIGGGGFPSGGGGDPMGGGGVPAGGAPAPSVSPTPTVEPNKTDNKNSSGKINLIGSDGAASVSMKENEQKGSIDISVDLSEDELLKQKNQNGSQAKPHDITLPIGSEQIVEQIKKENIKEVNVNITILNDLQNNKNVGDINSVLGEELLAAAKENGKDITVSVNDEDGKEQYSWTFTGDNLSKSNQDIKDINLSLEVEAVNKSELKELLSDPDSKENDSSDQNKGLVINFHHHGDLPSQASIRIYVGNQEGIKTGDKVTLYYYNSETNKLESLPNSSGYTVDADGYVTVQILHCSNYVLLTEAPDKSVVTSLMDQINTSVTAKTLYLGGTTGDTTDYMIKLPSTLEWVSSKHKPSSSAIGAVHITFASDNPKVAAVDNQGHITAKALGSCTISAKVKLYNGETKMYKATIKVKEPYIGIIKYKKTMKIGDTFLFEANTHGLKSETIEWSTSEKLILEINSKTGKVTAISSGTDYVIAKIGSKEVKVKVVVLEK